MKWALLGVIYFLVLGLHAAEKESVWSVFDQQLPQDKLMSSTEKSQSVQKFQSEIRCFDELQMRSWGSFSFSNPTAHKVVVIPQTQSGLDRGLSGLWIFWNDGYQFTLLPTFPNRITRFSDEMNRLEYYFEVKIGKETPFYVFYGRTHLGPLPDVKNKLRGLGAGSSTLVVSDAPFLSATPKPFEGELVQWAIDQSLNESNEIATRLLSGELLKRVKSLKTLSSFDDKSKLVAQNFYSDMLRRIKECSRIAKNDETNALLTEVLAREAEFKLSLRDSQTDQPVAKKEELKKK